MGKEPLYFNWKHEVSSTQREEYSQFYELAAVEIEMAALGNVSPRDVAIRLRDEVCGDGQFPYLKPFFEKSRDVYETANRIYSCARTLRGFVRMRIPQAMGEVREKKGLSRKFSLGAPRLPQGSKGREIKYGRGKDSWSA